MLTIIRYLLTGNCYHVCDYTQPYGWVPEACCPVHDPDTRFLKFMMRIVDVFVKVEPFK